MNYYSESFQEADDKFRTIAQKYNNIGEYTVKESDANIPVLTFGNGAKKIVINTGVHGLEGYTGSAILLKLLSEYSEFFKRISDNKDFTFVLIHGVNGFGMKHFIRGVKQQNIDLNRNFIFDWNNFTPIHNTDYAAWHELLTADPKSVNKVQEIQNRITSGESMDNIVGGQYQFPHGLFYGGTEAVPENIVLTQIYDDITKDANSLISIGIHTGAGKNYQSPLLVSHPKNHKNSQEFFKIFPVGSEVAVTPCSDFYKSLPGDFVDYAEERYKQIPVFTADLEFGTDTDRIYKSIAQGDAIFEMKNFGQLSNETKEKMRKSYYPDSKEWQINTMRLADVFMDNLINFIEKNR